MLPDQAIGQPVPTLPTQPSLPVRTEPTTMQGTRGFFGATQPRPFADPSGFFRNSVPNPFMGSLQEILQRILQRRNNFAFPEQANTFEAPFRNPFFNGS